MTPPITTVSLHTPPGRGGIAVLLLHGPRADAILAEAFRPLPAHADAPPNGLRLGRLVDERGEMDEAIVARCAGGIEINVHGGSAAAAAAMHRLRYLGAEAVDAPPASPECFGPAHPVLDNPAIGREMLAALAEARTPLTVAALTQQWSAGLSRLAREATAGGEGTGRRLRDAAGRLPQMQRLLRPAEVVLAGPPNVGKSTLANALVGRAVSLVHDAAGTTRDWVRELAVLRGVGVYLTDTAGLWDTADTVDAEAVRRARHRIAGADVVLLLSAGSSTPIPCWLLSAPPVARLDARTPRSPLVLGIAAQCDLHPPAGAYDAAVSARTGEGLDELAGRVLGALGLADLDLAAPAAFTERQAGLLLRAADALAEGQDGALGAAVRDLLGAGPQDTPAPEGK